MRRLSVVFDQRRMPKQPKTMIGWWECVGFPSMKLKDIKAKVDTGARTSALHAEQIEYFHRRGKDMVRYKVYPHQKDRRGSKWVESELMDERAVKSSVGMVTHRPVVWVPITMGGQTFEIELTLINRDLLGFRMLLGRQAMKGRFTIDPQKKNLLGKKKKK